MSNEQKNKSATQGREEAKAQSFTDFAAGMAMAVAKGIAAVVAMFAVKDVTHEGAKYSVVKVFSSLTQVLRKVVNICSNICFNF